MRLRDAPDAPPMSPPTPLQSLHCARLFDGERLLHDVRLTWSEGHITGLQPDAPRPAGDRRSIGPQWLVSPGLVDLQVNGGGGLMFNDDPSVAGACRIARAHARAGTTSLLLTLITDTRAKASAAQAAVRQALLAAVPGVAGLHLEGPYLQPARKGIHRAEFITTLTDVDVARIVAQAMGVPTLLTLAPECARPEQLRQLSDAGIRVFAGHTEARFDQIERAIAEGGLCGVTHLFNAMSQLGPREAGVVGAALRRPELWAGIILDGHHVSVPSADIAWRLRGREHMVLVSDAMAPSGTPQTEFMLQGVRIHVRNGRCEDDAGTLAGAAICLADAVRIGVQQYGLRLEDALYSASVAPARAMGLAHRIGRLQAGAQADLVLWNDALAVGGVLQRGAWALPVNGPPVSEADR